MRTESVTGGDDENGKDRDEILEFSTASSHWQNVGKMRNARNYHTTSVVKYHDFKNSLGC